MKKIVLLLAAASISHAASAQLPNNSLETWRTYASGSATDLEAPMSWYGIDSLIFNYGPLGGITPAKCMYKDTSAHTGTYAVKMVSKDMVGMVAPGMLVNARPDFDIAAYLANPSGVITDYLTFTGGTTVSSRYSHLTAWVKYAPVAGDVAVLGMQAIKSGIGVGGKDSVIGSGVLYLNATPSYTKVSIPMTYVDATTIPDKLLISFSSSDISDNPQDGSTLYVDDIDIVAGAASIKSVLVNEQFAEVFPNPAVNEIHFRSTTKNELTLKVYSSNGALLASVPFTQQISLSTNQFPSGTYFYQLADLKKMSIQEGKFNVVK